MMSKLMFGLFLLLSLAILIVTSLTPEEWQEVIKNCKEED